MELVRDSQGRLALKDGETLLSGDFTRLRPRLRPHALSRELLVRAARLKGIEGTPTAVDACAGSGEDGLLLAASGYSVTLIERDPLICALTADALERAREEPDLAPIVARMRLVEGDACEVLPTFTHSPDLIYLDPMFPARRKDSATKKKLQLFRRLEHPATDEEAEALLAVARSAGPRRIVVKRPLKGPYLASVKPSHSLAGKLIRYDCLIS